MRLQGNREIHERNKVLAPECETACEQINSLTLCSFECIILANADTKNPKLTSCPLRPFVSVVPLTLPAPTRTSPPASRADISGRTNRRPVRTTASVGDTTYAKLHRTYHKEAAATSHGINDVLPIHTYIIILSLGWRPAPCHFLIGNKLR